MAERGELKSTQGSTNPPLREAQEKKADLDAPAKQGRPTCLVKAAQQRRQEGQNAQAF